MLYIDSREKEHAIRGIVAYFDRHGIEWERRKLDTGDYMLEGHPERVIDRKAGLAELAHNMLSRDKARFYREIRRAREQGIDLIILCEQGWIRDLKDVAEWKPKYGKVSGRALADAIFRLEIGYGVPVLYCDKRSTGRRIVEILSGTGEIDGEYGSTDRRRPGQGICV